jgi:solute carrier family 35 (UDP-galactose transporter), member B1
MARAKQATPIRREPSSEYVSKHDRTLQSNGKANGNANANAIGTQTAKLPARKDAGIATLVIDVAGIYASL